MARLEDLWHIFKLDFLSKMDTLGREGRGKFCQHIVSIFQDMTFIEFMFYIEK